MDRSTEPRKVAEPTEPRLTAAERGPVSWRERAQSGTLPASAHGARAFAYPKRKEVA